LTKRLPSLFTTLPQLPVAIPTVKASCVGEVPQPQVSIVVDVVLLVVEVVDDEVLDVDELVDELLVLLVVVGSSEVVGDGALEVVVDDVVVLVVDAATVELVTAVDDVVEAGGIVVVVGHALQSSLQSGVHCWQPAGAPSPHGKAPNVEPSHSSPVSMMALPQDDGIVEEVVVEVVVTDELVTSVDDVVDSITVLEVVGSMVDVVGTMVVVVCSVVLVLVGQALQSSLQSGVQCWQPAGAPSPQGNAPNAEPSHCSPVSMIALPHDDGIVDEVVVEVVVTDELVVGFSVVDVLDVLEVVTELDVLVVGSTDVEVEEDDDVVVTWGTVVVGGGGHGRLSGRGTQMTWSLSRSFGFPADGMPVRSIFRDPGFFFPFFDFTATVTIVGRPHCAPLRLAGGGMLTPFA